MPTSRRTPLSRFRQLATAYRAARGHRPSPRATISPNGTQIWTRI